MIIPPRPPSLPTTRCIGGLIPVVGPEICQGSDSSDAFCHVGRGRRVLRQGDIQAEPVGGEQVSVGHHARSGLAIAPTFV